jgi:hypothetical protein
MIPSVDGWSVIVAGQWNPAIFSPEWIIGRLTQAQEVGIEVAVAPVTAFRFRFDGLSLRVGARRLMLGFDRADDETLQRVQPVVVRILRDLPHTPVSGVGVNFHYVEREPSADLLRIFDVRDHGALTNAGLARRETTIARRFDDRGLTLNLQLVSRDEGITFAFNFHAQSNNATDARTFLENHSVASLRDRSLAVLRDAYHLETEAVTA